MSRAQRTLLKIGTLAVLLVALFPPSFVVVEGRRYDSQFIWISDVPNAWQVNTSLLLVRVGVVVLVTGGLIAASRSSKA